jgi:CDP-glucose 4,6-dehydratase
MGADVSALALPSCHSPSIFELSGLAHRLDHAMIDIRDDIEVEDFVCGQAPQIVLHLAAQPIVLNGIEDPAGTIRTNSLGTLNLLQACRAVDGLRAVLVVTSDKVYGETSRVCSEADALGGTDPYSASKSCAELIAGVYRRHYLTAERGIGLATARAGNVIGGGDFSPHRLLPDLVRGAVSGETVVIRNPSATRPWQHVLDALGGYLCLAERLWHVPAATAPSWNFGPVGEPEWTVGEIAEAVCSNLGGRWRSDPVVQSIEAPVLRLSSERAVRDLGFAPKLSTRMAVDWTVAAYRELTRQQSTDWLSEQISHFQSLPATTALPTEVRLDVAASA